MPSYSSKSQKRSQSQSKNGGRRRKRTLKNVRRRKSRKVMRGGGFANAKINEPISKNFVIEDVVKFLQENQIDIPSNINTITYLAVRNLVNDKFDENISTSFTKKFPA